MYCRLSNCVDSVGDILLSLLAQYLDLASIIIVFNVLPIFYVIIEQLLCLVIDIVYLCINSFLNHQLPSCCEGIINHLSRIHYIRWQVTYVSAADLVKAKAKAADICKA